jgi:glycosyltransferase involved in cell wall biosynthesis
MRTQLVLITAGFPFGTGETFLENEIAFLADGFEHVHIVCPEMRVNTQRILPANCTVYRFNNQLTLSDKIRAFSGVFTSEFKNEMRIVRQKYSKNISLGILKTALISLFQGKRLAQFLNKQFLQQNDSEKWVFYSYWCDDAAVALALLSTQHDSLNTVTRMHRWDIYFEENKYDYLPYRHFITKNIDKIFSISQDGIDYAKAVWKTGLDEIFVLSRLGISNSVAPAIIERDYFLLVSCSNIIPVKRVHLIAESLKEIKDVAIKWVHFGDGSERLALENTIKNLSSTIQVELMGRKDNKEIYTYYKENRPDLFINVSSSEGIPVSIMEAMSFGIPVIATNVGGNCEIVNEKNGRILPMNFSVDRLSEYILVFMNTKIRNECSIEAIKTWNILYNAKKNYSDFCNQLKV